MKHTWSSPSHPAAAGSRTTRRSLAAIVVVASTALALGACGGDDDDDADESTTSTTLALDVTTTTDAATTTSGSGSDSTTTTTAVPGEEVEYVTEGASVVVANASGVNGAAGRMSDRLAAVGFDMGTPTNSSEGQLELTKIYYDPANTDALPVAESLRLGLGGGDIQLFEMGAPAPVDDGDIGDATVLVTMGNDTADKTLEQLQGRAPVTETTDTGSDTTDPTDTDESTTTTSTG